MHYGRIIENDVANGPGIRVSLFVSGCRNHCPGCFNQETWDFNFGEEYNDQVAARILKVLDNPYIEGLTILGGEPFEEENQPEVKKLLDQVRQKYGSAKTIWMYTGYLLDKDLKPGGRKHTDYTDSILSMADVIVDGPFLDEKKDLMLRFKGSSNQRIWHKSEEFNNVFWNFPALE